mgnify:CR=1 FL=1
MKYYIPTTTLNFNNILSSESVSPYIFFQKRGFGYSRWFVIPENEQCNCIVLYDSLSYLERGDSELEDHPMVIEINTNEIFREVEKGIYISDKTIYLNPWNTRFIFFNEQDRKVALSLSDSSLETKMIRLYQKGFEIRFADKPYSRLKNEVLGELNNSEIEHDRIINRLKGLMYGYYIGALLSSEKSTVEYYNTLKDLQNIFAAILSNPRREPTSEQELKVNSLTSSLLFYNPIFREIEHLVRDRDMAIEVVKIFKKHGHPISNLNPSSFFRALREDSPENNSALQWISEELKHINSISQINRVQLSPEASEIVVVDNKLRSIGETVILDKVDNNLFIELINHILTDESINGKISSQRAELADNLTGKARDVLGVEWETSPIRTFLNQLRKHIRGDEFNQKWNNGVLSSLAAVVLKGDDWEVLLDFMKRKGMTDYRLAYAFYGVFNGFANLTRDFTDLLLNNDSAYVASVYKEFHGSIHGEKIETLSPAIEPESPKATSVIPVVKSYKDRIWDFYISNVRKRKKNQAQLDEELKCALERIGDSEDGYVFVCVLNDYSLWCSKTKAWTEMQQEFCPDYEKIRKSKKPHSETSQKPISKREKGLWGGVKETLGGIFAGIEKLGDSSLDDSGNSSVEENIKHLTTTPKRKDSIINSTEQSMLNRTFIPKSIISDDYALDRIIAFLGTNVHIIIDLFTEFQRSYRSGYYSKHPDQYRRNNSDVIDHFCKWCLSTKNKKALEKTPANSRKLDELKSFLLQYYHD